jgi:hypothetical protein
VSPPAADQRLERVDDPDHDVGPFRGKPLQVAFAQPELVMDDPPPGLHLQEFRFR